MGSFHGKFAKSGCLDSMKFISVHFFHPKLTFSNATVHVITRVRVEKLCKISCFQSVPKMVRHAFTFARVQYSLHRLLVPPIEVQYKTELCDTIAFQISCVKRQFFCVRFVAKYSYKILADSRKNLLEAKVCNCFVSSQWQILLFILYTPIPVKFTKWRHFPWIQF